MGIDDLLSSDGWLQHRIGGERVNPSVWQGEDLVNPATGEILGKVAFAEADDVDLAVRSAKAAFADWSRTPVARRARILFRYQHLLSEHAEELAELIRLENGKTRSEALAEVRRAIENVEFAAGAPTLMMGRGLATVAAGIESAYYRYPIGVVAGITPFNFPMMVPAWMYPMAIALGNTFVLKPSERTPLTAVRAAELFFEAGLPPGVLNVVHGARTAVTALLHHPGIQAVSFVGSQRVAEVVYREASACGKRVQALGGAKNHAIVLPDADLEQAVRQITASAFGTGGQRCLASAVVVAVGSTADSLVNRLVEAADRLVPGDGRDPTVTLGPVIRDTQRERALHYIRLGIEEGAQLRRDGRADAVPESGYFIGPTIFDRVTSAMTLWSDEIFAPVLAVARVSSLEQAIDLANRSHLANAACLFTDSARAIRQFREEIDAGMLGVNVGVPAPMAFFPFSGWKQSFYGDLHANGEDSVAFYTRKKTVTARS